METPQTLLVGVLFEPGVEPPRLFHCCRPPNGLPVLYTEIEVIGTCNRDNFIALACTNPTCSGMPGIGLSLREFVHLRHELEELRLIQPSEEEVPASSDRPSLIGTPPPQWKLDALTFEFVRMSGAELGVASKEMRFSWKA